MAPSTASPALCKTKTSVTSMRTPKSRSSIAKQLFRKGSKKTLLAFTSPRLNPATSNSSYSRGDHRREGRSLNDQRVADARETHMVSRIALEEDDDSIKSDTESDQSNQEDTQNWLDGSTLWAQYQDVESETEEQHAIALVDYLQVPLQEKFHELKRDLCDGLLTAMNDIRQAHIKASREADIDRGKGIIHLNDAYDKRDADASRTQTQLKEHLAVNQLEINKLFIQLKQAYDRRNQLWVDLQSRIDDLTNLQATVLDQLDENMAHVVDTFDKKCQAMLKDDTSKGEEKLLRGVLKKL